VKDADGDRVEKNETLKNGDKMSVLYAARDPQIVFNEERRHGFAILSDAGEMSWNLTQDSEEWTLFKVLAKSAFHPYDL